MKLESGYRKLILLLTKVVFCFSLFFLFPMECYVNRGSAVNENILAFTYSSIPLLLISALVYLFLRPKNKLTVKIARRTAFYAVSCSFVFSLFFLMPLDLYLHNFINFNIGVWGIIFPFFIVSVTLLLVLLIVFPLVFRGGFLNIVTFGLCGITLAAYAQVLFLNGNMKMLTGDVLFFSDMSFSSVFVNWVVFIMIMCLPVVFYYTLLQYKKIRWSTGIISISIVVLGMQVAGIIAAIPAYNSSSFDGFVSLGYNNSKDSQNYSLSYDNVFSLSDDENILVFILDRLDVKFMDTALADYPELYEQLDGFTFYENNTSMYSGTFPSIVHLFTGVFYDTKESWPEYFDRAWAKRNIIDVLRENGYTSTLLVSKASAYSNIKHIQNRASNITPITEKDITLHYPEIIKTVLSVSLGRVVPYLFKDLFIMNISEGFSNEFYKTTNPNIVLPSISGKRDVEFYTHLKMKGLDTLSRQKVFSFAHLYSVHGKNYHYDPKTESVEFYNGTNNDALRGSLEILNEYFKQMKALGVYDKTTIFILADHGRWTTYVTENGHQQYRDEVTASLLIKPKNSRGRLVRDSMAELSHVNFGASILQSAGIPHEDFGASYFDIIENGESQVRIHSPLGYLKEGSVIPIGTYEITGNANDFKNWKFIPAAQKKKEE
ncbi:MAG: sulfatase-like hydrolase/transferase [Fibrobacter sp.]|jgi:hypothetical protein|nr:sulfatase-like hydrolase/transferase [Fibrobacter sp.]